jgi:hypothetical protein
MALAVLLPLGAGCAGLSDPLHVPLFFEYDTVTDTEWTTVPVLLSGKKQDRKTGHERYYGLWPFLSWSKNGLEREFRFLGAPVYQKRVDHAGFFDTDMILGPVFYGSSRDEGTYLTILPFGGTLKGKIAKDHITWILPPLYIYAHDETAGGVKKSHNILFPFVNWVSGGGHSGFRVMPFFSRYRRHDREGQLAWEMGSVLWPFFTYRDNNLNLPGKEQHLWFLWPFYGQLTGPKFSGWYGMWPFFRYWENRGTGGGGPYWEIRAPFPFFTYGRGRTQERTDIWPLWGHRHRRQSLSFAEGYDEWERYFAAWPIWRWERHETNEYRDDKWFLLPLVWSYAFDPKPGHTAQKTRTFKLWPLFRYRLHADGRKTFNLISPLWFNDPHEGAFEAIYNPLTRVYEQQDRGDRKWLLLLWGLYQRHEDAANEWAIVHPWLYWDHEAKDGGERDVAFLFGLFRYVRRGNKKALRFFWLPEWPSWGGDGEE